MTDERRRGGAEATPQAGKADLPAESRDEGVAREAATRIDVSALEQGPKRRMRRVSAASGERQADGQGATVVASVPALERDSLDGHGQTLRRWRFKLPWKRQPSDDEAWDRWRYRGLRSRLKRTGRQKIYRFKGYTTAARVDRKRRRERLRHQRNQLIITALIVVILILAYLWLDPLPKLQQLRHVLGF